MSLGEDLADEVQKIFKEEWSTREGKKVPESADLALGNDAVKLDGTVLYADLDDSTNLVDYYKPAFAAEIYKAYLNCAAKIIRSEGGVITSYDGDRIMAVYIGGVKKYFRCLFCIKNKLRSYQDNQSYPKRVLPQDRLPC